MVEFILRKKGLLILMSMQMIAMIKSRSFMTRVLAAQLMVKSSQARSLVNSLSKSRTMVQLSKSSKRTTRTNLIIGTRFKLTT